MDAQGTAAGRNPADVLSAARDLHDLIDSRGEWNDREGRIAEPVVDALYESGAISVFLPRALGGAEMSPRQAMDLFATLSHADPSTGQPRFFILPVGQVSLL